MPSRAVISTAGLGMGMRALGVRGVRGPGLRAHRSVRSWQQKPVAAGGKAEVWEGWAPTLLQGVGGGPAHT